MLFDGEINTILFELNPSLVVVRKIHVLLFRFDLTFVLNSLYFQLS